MLVASHAFATVVTRASSAVQTFLLVGSHRYLTMSSAIQGHMPHNVYDPTCSCCSDEEGSELADLQRVLQKVVSSKKANARQKQAEIIQVTC